MSFFNSIGSAISIVDVCNERTNSEIEKSINEEKVLTKKIAKAKKEIEEFSLEADESFLNDTTNIIRD